MLSETACYKVHQNALLAGLLTVTGDAVVSIDVGLQDDENSINDMIDEYHRVYDVVYGVRKTRTFDTLFKRLSAQAFYKLLNLMGVNVVYNHAVFRLISRRVIDALGEFQEVNQFLMVLFHQLVFNHHLLLCPHAGVKTGWRNDSNFINNRYPLRAS